MTLKKFDALCAKLSGATMVIQWGESHVWKAGGKVFAIGGEGNFVFKTSPLTFEILLAQGTATRAPYLPRGGWVQVTATALPEKDFAAYIGNSHALVARALPKAAREKLGL